MIELDHERGSAFSRSSSSMPQGRRISIVRRLRLRALGWIVVPGWRSTSRLEMPRRERQTEAFSPTGPPPAMRTGACTSSSRRGRSAAPQYRAYDRDRTPRVGRRLAKRSLARPHLPNPLRYGTCGYGVGVGVGGGTHNDLMYVSMSSARQRLQPPVSTAPAMS